MDAVTETNADISVMDYDSAFVITWRSPFPGREGSALAYAADADVHWSKQAAEGRCTEPEWLFHPDGWGMWMVRGVHEELDRLVQQDESKMLIARGTLLLDGFQYAIAPAGRGADRYVTNYAAIASELGLL